MFRLLTRCVKERGLSVYFFYTKRRPTPHFFLKIVEDLPYELKQLSKMFKAGDAGSKLTVVMNKLNIDKTGKGGKKLTSMVNKLSSSIPKKGIFKKMASESGSNSVDPQQVEESLVVVFQFLNNNLGEIMSIMPKETGSVVVENIWKNILKSVEILVLGINGLEDEGGSLDSAGSGELLGANDGSSSSKATAKSWDERRIAFITVCVEVGEAYVNVWCDKIINNEYF